MAYNYANEGTEGGSPGVHPAFSAGQDSFLASLETKGIRNETYWQAVEYCRTQAGPLGIDAYVQFSKPCWLNGINTSRSPCRALKYNKTDGTIGTLDGLLVPSDVGQTTQIPAQAGSSFVFPI